MVVSTTWKTLGAMALGGFVLFSAGMIVIRLKMTELAYDFESIKNEERRLHEEQVKLKAALSEKLSPAKWKSDGFREPEPEQVIAIP